MALLKFFGSNFFGKARHIRSGQQVVIAGHHAIGADELGIVPIALASVRPQFGNRTQLRAVGGAKPQYQLCHDVSPSSLDDDPVSLVEPLALQER